MGLFNFLQKSKPEPELPKEKARVLVVDDEKELIDFYVELLTGEGYELSSAFNGQEALDLIAIKSPHVILLDIMMPVMNGNEVLAKLQTDEKTKNIPVIMLTNAGKVDNITNARLHNVYNFFIKSNIDPSEIIQAVKGALDPQMGKQRMI